MTDANTKTWSGKLHTQAFRCIWVRLSCENIAAVLHIQLAVSSRSDGLSVLTFPADNNDQCIHGLLKDHKEVEFWSVLPVVFCIQYSCLFPWWWFSTPAIHFTIFPCIHTTGCNSVRFVFFFSTCLFLLIFLSSNLLSLFCSQVNL